MNNEILCLDGEIWMDIKGYEGLYQVSNLGRIKRLKRTIERSNGKIYPMKEIIRKSKINFGYEKIGLTNQITKKYGLFSVHRLVALAFIPNPNNLPIVHHKDHNSLNNHVDNLMWVTNKQNIEFANKSGRLKKQYRKDENKRLKENILPEYYINNDIQLPNEIWKDITGHNGKYQISNYGRVMSFSQLTPNGKLRRPIFANDLRTNGNYLFLPLWEGKKSKKYLIHRLVAIHFISNPQNLSDVNHIDGDKTNNSTANLEWNSHNQNTIHAVRTGLTSVSNLCKLTEKNVIKIRKLKEEGLSINKIAENFNVCKRSISNIIKRKSWKYI